MYSFNVFFIEEKMKKTLCCRMYVKKFLGIQLDLLLIYILPKEKNGSF